MSLEFCITVGLNAHLNMLPFVAILLPPVVHIRHLSNAPDFLEAGDPILSNHAISAVRSRFVCKN
jgi:hypothetical protein